MSINFLWEIFIVTAWRLIAQFFYAPIWWYSHGVVLVGRYFLDLLKEKYRVLAIRILLENFWRPMYGVRDIWGRIISLGARILLLGWRLGQLILWVAWGIFLVAAWIGGPALAVYFLYRHYFM